MKRNELDNRNKISFHPQEELSKKREDLFSALRLSGKGFQFRMYQTFTVSIGEALTQKHLKEEEIDALKRHQILADTDLAKHIDGCDHSCKETYFVNKVNLLNLQGEQKENFERDERVQIIIPSLVGGLQKEFTSYKNKFKELEDKLKTLEETLDQADIKCIAEINAKVDEMKTKQSFLYEYYVTLYWAFSNHLLTYRASANGMLAAGGAEGSKAVVKLSTMGSILGVVSSIASNIPIIGNSASTAIDLLGAAVDKVKDLRLEEAIKIVNKVIEQSFPMEAKMYSDIAMFCIKLTYSRKQEILDPSKEVKETPKTFSGKLKLYHQVVVEVYKKCKEKCEAGMITGTRKIMGESSITVLEQTEEEKRLKELATNDASIAIAIILDRSEEWKAESRDDKLFSELLVKLFIEKNQLTLPLGEEKAFKKADDMKVEDLETKTRISSSLDENQATSSSRLCHLH